MRTGGIDYLFIQAVTSISNSTTYGRLPVNRIIGAKAAPPGAQGKPEVGWLTVDAESAGQRLDNFLIRHLKGVPKTHVYRIIRSGEVRVNKGRAAADTRVAAGDRVRVPPVRVAERSADAATAPAREFPTLLEDDHLIALDKPAGVAVHGGSGISLGVIEQIRRARPEARYLELVHRLDKDTSGLLMIAKKRSALVKLHEAIRNDHPKKIYLALGVGKFAQDKVHVKLPLYKYTGAQGEKMVRVSEEGQSAHTILRVLKRFSGAMLHQIGLSDLTYIEATLKTGRTHQIRVHMQSQACPIAGDERYGDYQANKRLQKIGLKRMFLHASEFHLSHPLTDEPLKLVAPLPQELAQMVAMLEK